MANFEFQTCPHIINRAGCTAELGQLCRTRGFARPLIVTDAGILNAGLLQDVERSFSEAGLSPLVYSDVKEDPPEQIILSAAEFMVDHEIDSVIGFGGGSAMDTAKLVAVLGGGEQALSEMFGVDQVVNSRMPLILVPTTAGTGSEVTPISIVTRPDDTKMGVVSSVLLPDIAMLDAKLTIGLPAHVTAATGIDAMVHAIEAYTSAIRKNVYSDMLACKALELLAPNLLRAVRDPSNLDARQSMLFGACLAGQAFANAPVGAVHALAYPLGGQFHIPHGLSNALVLSKVMEFNVPEAAGHYAKLAPYIMGSKTPSGSDSVVSNALAAFLQELSRESGLPQTLKELDIPESSLESLASDAMQQQRLLVNNPRLVEYNDALEIYRAVY